MRSFHIKAIDTSGRRLEFTQLATSCAHAEQLAADIVGDFRLLFARSC